MVGVAFHRWLYWVVLIMFYPFDHRYAFSFEELTERWGWLSDMLGAELWGTHDA